MSGTDMYSCHKVIVAEWENKGTRIIELDGRMDAIAGQFLMVWLPGVGEKPYSIMQPDPLTLLVADAGPFSHALAQVELSNRIWVRGPLGNGFVPRLEEAMLIGGGYGAAPLYFLALTLKSRETKARVFWEQKQGKSWCW